MQKAAILVTGGAGYIGSHTVLALRAQGYPVVVLDDLSTGNAALIHPEAKFYQGDIADTALLTRIFSEQKINAVMHFAAKLIVPESVANPAKYYENNVTKFMTLLNTANDAGVRNIIFSSTAAVYGEPENVPANENTPCNPINPYGASKYMAERILADTARASGKMRYGILRYFNVAGADPAGRSGQMMPDATHLIKVAAEVAIGKREGMQIFGTDYDTPDGTCVRDYIHVSDLADAHVKLLSYLQDGGESVTLNCGYGHGYSVAEVVDTVSAAVHYPINVKLADRRAGDPAMLVADSTRLRELLNWTPIYDNLRDIVRSALQWEARVEDIRAQQKKVKAA